MEQELKEAEIKPNKVAFRAAITFSLYTLALIFIFKLLHIDSMQENMNTGTKVITTILSYVPFILAIVYAQTKHRTDLGGYMTFARGFSTGFKVAAYTGLFVSVLLVLYYKVLDRGAMDHILDVAIDKANGDEKQIKAIEMTRPYMAIISAFFGAITYTIFGMILSLIGAVLFKKERPLPQG
ncbi:DUF4199 domain-containing protein [Pedobacter cryoconitis]|uniref:DUF4199 domain-containing protein n=1 Tax=Pedobacter cryoconitis TaxID=188932 RepID=A0A7X0MGP7_9SPHI|nr:DUF4199 domain-containing protein [Pedobacter cryoconitis]MBB6498001.1 hypothetical protein [Pedobacter cryoconitis]